jgi:hypothetical protein
MKISKEELKALQTRAEEERKATLERERQIEENVRKARTAEQKAQIRRERRRERKHYTNIPDGPDYVFLMTTDPKWGVTSDGMNDTLSITGYLWKSEVGAHEDPDEITVNMRGGYIDGFLTRVVRQGAPNDEGDDAVLAWLKDHPVDCEYYFDDYGHHIRVNS